MVFAVKTPVLRCAESPLLLSQLHHGVQENADGQGKANVKSVLSQNPKKSSSASTFVFLDSM